MTDSFRSPFQVTSHSSLVKKSQPWLLSMESGLSDSVPNAVSVSLIFSLAGLVAFSESSMAVRLE